MVSIRHLVFLFYLYPCLAFANTIPSTSNSGFIALGAPQPFTTYDEACTFVGFNTFGFNPTRFDNGPNDCTFKIGNNYYSQSYQIHTGFINSCPSGYTLDSGGATCTGMPPATCTAKQPITGVFDTPTPTHLNADTTAAQMKSATQGCLAGCTTELNPKGVDWVSYDDNTGAHFVTANLRQTGATCTTGSTPVTTSQNQTQKDCIASGRSFGQVNGLDVCLPKGTAGSVQVTTPSETIKTTPDGTTERKKLTTANPDGSITTIITTTINNSPPTTETQTQDRKTFCEENPNSKLCKDSFINPSCQGFSCDGDAIQCSIAKRAYDDRCEANISKTQIDSMSQNIIGQGLVNGNYTSDVQSYLSQNGQGSGTIVNVPNSLTETGNSSFSGSQIQDLTQTVDGKTFTLPFSKVNYWFIVFGNVLLALTYFAAYKIVTKDIA